jgi:hypothetical protein
MDSPSVNAIPALSGESVHGAIIEQSEAQHRRLHSLDILRGLAACGVMIPHFFMYAGGENLTAEIISSCAVEVFFVLSGFVLGPQVLLCMNRGNLRTYGIFLLRRWMRTVPPYLIALVAVSVFTKQLWSTDFFRYSIYVGNLFDQHLTKDFFPVAWSLAVEEWYYVVFPLLMIATVPFLRQTGRHRLCRRDRCYPFAVFQRCRLGRAHAPHCYLPHRLHRLRLSAVLVRPHRADVARQDTITCRHLRRLRCAGVLYQH